MPGAPAGRPLRPGGSAPRRVPIGERADDRGRRAARPVPDRRPVRHRERATHAIEWPRGSRSPAGWTCRTSSRRRTTRPTAQRRAPSAARVSSEGSSIWPKCASVGVPMLTDVHEPGQVRAGGRGRRRAADPGVPVPADRSAASRRRRTGRAVNIKKGQFLSPWDMKHVVDKVVSTGHRERHGDGARHLLRLRQPGRGHALLRGDAPRAASPVVFDATHSVQLPGGLGDRSGGDAPYIAFARAGGGRVGVDALLLRSPR